VRGVLRLHDGQKRSGEMTEPEKPKSQGIRPDTHKEKDTFYPVTLTVYKASELRAALARDDVKEVIFTEQGRLQKTLAIYALLQNISEQFFGLLKPIVDRYAKKVLREQVGEMWEERWKLRRDGFLKFTRKSTQDQDK
jgi:hypothetical protein